MTMPGADGPPQPDDAALDAQRAEAERDAVAQFQDAVLAAVSAAPDDPAAFETHARAQIIGAFNELDAARAAAHAADPRNLPATTP